MDPNLCDVNHLDGDVILPPRKRLLAGLRSQNSPDSAEGPLQLSLSASPSNPSFTPPSSPPTSFEFNDRLRSLIISHHEKELSPREIAEASRSAAAAATRVARAARAAAEERAEAAALAMASAKKALEFAASLSSEELEDLPQQRSMRKNKKHVPVQLLYRKNGPVENCVKDEEVARKLHRAINSSPRIVTKNSSGSESKGNKDRRRKKPRSSNGADKDSLVGGIVSEPNSNGHVAVRVDGLEFV